MGEEERENMAERERVNPLCLLSWADGTTVCFMREIEREGIKVHFIDHALRVAICDFEKSKLSLVASFSAFLVGRGGFRVLSPLSGDDITLEHVEAALGQILALEAEAVEEILLRNDSWKVTSERRASAPKSKCPHKFRRYKIYSQRTVVSHIETYA